MTVGAVNSAKTVTMSKYKKVKKPVYITVEKYYDDLGKVNMVLIIQTLNIMILNACHYNFNFLEIFISI